MLPPTDKGEHLCRSVEAAAGRRCSWPPGVGAGEPRARPLLLSALSHNSSAPRWTLTVVPYGEPQHAILFCCFCMEDLVRRWAILALFSIGANSLR